jgi:molybdopterin synthase sulfur carrier subunit
MTVRPGRGQAETAALKNDTERCKEIMVDSQTTMPNITVFLPHALRARVGNRKTVMAAGHTVREIIAALDRDFPGLRFNLCYETGELRPYVNIFLGREDIRYLHGLDTPVYSGSTMYILQSVAGG